MIGQAIYGPVYRFFLGILDFVLVMAFHMLYIWLLLIAHMHTFQYYSRVAMQTLKNNRPRIASRGSRDYFSI